MNRHRVASALVIAMILSSCDWVIGTEVPGTIIDHEATSVAGLTEASIAHAKETLRIVYWHTSHGSQISDGMAGMDAFYGGSGLYAIGGADAGIGYLRFDDHYECDLGSDPDWDTRTSDWLRARPAVNVVVWSWCGQVSDATEGSIAEYLARMASLEESYPEVRFVYMTGHADGTGLTGNLHLRNLQIRDYCEANGKWLYDFYDIECYDPDGAYYGDKRVSDACNYDYDGDGATEGTESGPSGGDRNWAADWQDSHQEGADWWACGSAHSLPLNANQKARAAWNLWVRLARSI